MNKPTIKPVAYPEPDGSFTMRAAADITDFIVHHSAGPVTQTPLEIDAFERSRQDIYIPYTWLIDSLGNIYAGRPPLAVSAASYGRNRQSVAVCCIGNFQSDDPGYTGQPSQAMLDSLVALCAWAHVEFPSISRTFAHGDIARLFYGGDPDYATACCGDVLRAKIPDLKSRVAALMKHGGA